MKMGTFGRFQKHQVWEMTQDINQFWGLSFGKELKKDENPDQITVSNW